VNRGWRNLVGTSIQFAFGTGAVWVIGAIVIFAALVASDSRAGIVATMFGLGTAFVISLFLSARRQTLLWAVTGGAVAFVAMSVLFLIGGNNAASRFGNLVETAGRGELRPVMWHAAEHAIADHPLLGIGLGAYHEAYYLYADQFIPFVVDRAHNDYLELTAGLGIPAACIWVGALGLLGAQCVRAIFVRHRRRGYAVTAVAATALIAVHSLFDFSMQMPAVSVVYAAILGVGLAQARGARPTAG
jgi:O-antigen ligase